MAAARSRRSWTASSAGARASWRAAHLAVADAEVVQRHGEVGEEGGVGAGQVAAELDGFLGGGQGVLRGGPPRCSGCRGCSAPLARSGRKAGLVARPGRGRAGRLPRWGPGRPGGGPPRCSGRRGCSAPLARSGRKAGLARGQVAVELDGFLGGGQGVLAAAHLAVADAEVVQRRGEVGEEGGVGRGPGRGRAGRLPRWGPGRPGGGPPRCSGCRGCSAPWRGRGGRRGWRAARSRRSWTASSVGARASWRRPTSL